MIEFESSPKGLNNIATKPFVPQIKVIGIGGGGCRVISRLKSIKRGFIRFTALDTSKKELENCKVEEKILLENSFTQGWGTGGDSQIGRKVAMEGENRLREILRGVDLLFLVCGLGKGIGSGASSVVAQIAKELGCLTIGFFILPFYFEGEKRAAQAKKTLEKLEELVNGLMIINNDSLLKLDNPQGSLSLEEGFRKVDELLEISLKAMEYLLFTPGLISIDFADVKNALSKKGEVKITMGKGKGEKAGEEAVRQALSSPLWGGISLKKTSSILLGIRGGKKFSLNELEKMALTIQEEAEDTTEFSMGVSIDDELSNEVILTLVASGIKMEKEVKREKPYQEKLDLGTYDEDNLDIPTFLRKGNN